MATVTLSSPLQVVSSGNTTDNSLQIGSFTQAAKLKVNISVQAGPIYFSLNSAASDDGSSTPVSEGETLELMIRNDIDTIHWLQTANGDSFVVTSIDLV